MSIGPEEIRSIRIFEDLKHNELQAIAERAVLHRFKKGTAVYCPHCCDGFYMVCHGKVKVYDLSEGGKEQMIRILSEGSFLGEESLFIREESSSFAEALSDVEMYYIERKKFLDLLKEYPNISLRLLEECSHRLMRLKKIMIAKVSSDVTKRLAAYLLNQYQIQQSETIILPLQKKELAVTLVTTAETISRKLKQMTDEGLIAMKARNITILDPEGMKRIVEE